VGAQAIIEIRRRERGGVVHLEKDARALPGAIADARQALLDEAAARAAAPEFSRELGERSHRSPEFVPFPCAACNLAELK
jgi:hypothetical protein